MDKAAAVTPATTHALRRTTVSVGQSDPSCANLQDGALFMQYGHTVTGTESTKVECIVIAKGRRQLEPQNASEGAAHSTRKAIGIVTKTISTAAKQFRRSETDLCNRQRKKTTRNLRVE